MRNTAPFLEARPSLACDRLIALPISPNSYLDVLAAWERIREPALSRDEQLQDYFVLCLACHHATVATFVPTDVDTKIRGLIWRRTRDRDALRAMADFALGAAKWDCSPVSRRHVEVDGAGAVSGHNGEWLSVVVGAHGRMLALGDAEYAEKTGEAIDTELRREARAFAETLDRPGAELDTLRLASAITHNLGDVDQGIASGRALRRLRSLARALGGWLTRTRQLTEACSRWPRSSTAK